jgi:hypothetical protein
MPLAPAEAVVRSWLATYLGAGYRVVTELPPELATVCADTPVAQVTRFGGSDDLYVFDTANIDVDTFDLAHDGKSSRENARDFGEKVRSGLRFRAPGSVLDDAFIATVTTISAPRWVPYDNTDLRRFVASYRITIRSVPIEGVPA